MGKYTRCKVELASCMHMHVIRNGAAVLGQDDEPFFSCPLCDLSHYKILVAGFHSKKAFHPAVSSEAKSATSDHYKHYSGNIRAEKSGLFTPKPPEHEWQSFCVILRERE